jgi:cyclase
MHLKRWLVMAVWLVAVNGYAQQDFDNVEIQTVPVAKGIYMLAGQGGNIGLSVGEDGVFLIDDQYAPLTQKIIAAIHAITDKPLKFVVNTHWHADHTGGNENIGKGGAVIVAHHNVRKRMMKGQFLKAIGANIPPADPKALPVITFDQGVTFHWNNETLEVHHPKPAHTDGDAVIYFKNANVVHVGDLFFNGIYPFIDEGSGGSMTGMITGVENVLSRINDDTKLIPGHGPLADASDLKTYRDMLTTVHMRIKKLMGEGKTIEEIVHAKPTEDFDNKWGHGFLKPDQWVKIVCSVMK